MFENIRNVITRLRMDRLRRNLGGHIPSRPRHVPHDLVAHKIIDFIKETRFYKQL